MDFVHYDLGYLVEGTTVVVSLDVAANVCVLDFANFMYYKMDISFMYLGGYITRSPYYVVIPRGGFWHVAIDLGGYEGAYRFECRDYIARKNRSWSNFYGVSR